MIVGTRSTAHVYLSFLCRLENRYLVAGVELLPGIEGQLHGVRWYQIPKRDIQPT